MSTVPLEKRTAGALGGTPTTSADLQTLIADTEAAIAEADAAAETERGKALDPVLSPDANKAREAIQAAEFSRERLRTALPRLQARHQEIAAGEYLENWCSNYEALKAKRDALAAEMAATYPKMVDQLVDLFTRLKANDAELSGLHQARPAGAGLHLLGPELVARGLAGFSTANPSLAEKVQLPDFQQSDRMAWPPPQVPFGVLMAESMVPAPHPGGDWWRVKEEAARAARERQEREVAEQEAKALENYHGPRWWEHGRA